MLHRLLLVLLVLVVAPAAQDAPTPPTLERATATASLNLLTIELPAGRVEGYNVNHPGWTGNTKKINPKAQGFDGVRFVGKGVGATVLYAGYSGALIVGENAGVVVLEDLTVECGERYGIKIGKADDDDTRLSPIPIYPDSLLRLRDVEFRAKTPAAGKKTTTVWVVHSASIDHDWLRVTFDDSCAYSSEHGLYAHGFAKRGLYWKRVRLEAIGAEGLKVCTRPWEVQWSPGWVVWLEDCEFRNWFQPWSWRGGAAVTMQGPGVQWLVVDRCVFVGRGELAGLAPASGAILCSDGLSTIRSAWNNRHRFYDMQGNPGGIDPNDPDHVGSAMGHVLIRNSAVQGFGGKEAIRFGTIAPGYEEAWGMPYHYIAESVTIRNAAVYGETWNGQRTRASIREIRDDRVRVVGCNNEALELFVSRWLGFNTTTDAVVSTNWGSWTFAQGVAPRRAR